MPVADLGYGPGGPTLPPPLIFIENEEMTEGRKAGSASKTKPPSLPAPHELISLFCFDWLENNRITN